MLDQPQITSILEKLNLAQQTEKDSHEEFLNEYPLLQSASLKNSTFTKANHDDHSKKTMKSS
jgi:hypothetical protein